MTKTSERTLIAWAVQEIRELDELCRVAVDGYEPLDSSEMGRLKELEKMSAGQAAEALTTEEHEKETRTLRKEVVRLQAALEEIHALTDPLSL